MPWVSKLETKVETKIFQNGEYSITAQNPSIECIGNAKLSVYVPNNVETGYNTYLIKTGEGEEDKQVKKINEVKENEVVITTENGTKTLELFNEDEHKMTKKYTVITNVDKDTNVQPLKTVTITENGETLIEPDEGYEAVSLVTASVNVPTPEPNLEEKEIDITTAGETEILPSEGYDGMSKVTVTTHSKEEVIKDISITPTTTAVKLEIEEINKVMNRVNIMFTDPLLPNEHITINSIKAKFHVQSVYEVLTANPSAKIFRNTYDAKNFDYTTSSSIPRDTLVSGFMIAAVAINTNYESSQDRKWGKISLLILDIPHKNDIPTESTYTLTYSPKITTDFCDIPNTIYLMNDSDGFITKLNYATEYFGFYDTHSYGDNTNYIHPFDKQGMVGSLVTVSGESYINGYNSFNYLLIGEFSCPTLYGSDKIKVYEYARIYGNFIVESN